MIYGYARVSTDAQERAADFAVLKAARHGRIFREKMSGTTAERPQFKRLLKEIDADDVLIIPAVDRLSRDTTDLLVIAREIERAGAHLKSFAEPYIDMSSDAKEIALAALGIAAKFERRRIKERTMRGRALANGKGVKFGRKPSLTPQQQAEAIRRRDVDRETLRSIARSYNVGAATISRLGA